MHHVTLKLYYFIAFSDLSQQHVISAVENMLVFCKAKYVLLLVVTLVFKKILCICEDSHIVICDDITDIKDNETTPWLHVQIGSLEKRVESPNHVLNRSLFFTLSRTRFLTIINQLRLISRLPEHRHLRYLNFYGNNILEISDNTFSRMYLLKEAYLKNNNIQHLGREIFQNLTLDVVDLSRNRIQSIRSGFYNTKIKWLLLNHNKINYLGFEPFPPSLQQLELNDNLLETIEHEYFRNLRSLKELYLENNRLTTISNILDLKNIQFLHFAYNNIQEVHFRFDQLPKLEFLDLGFNSIHNVTTDVFSAVKSAPIVVLSFNKLSNMVFEHPERKTDLVLFGNPWICECWFKIEKIISKHHHQQTCDFKIFDKGQIPLCIEGGQCSGTLVVARNDIDNYLKVVSVVQDDVKRCNFRL
ncbi:hypothetical protein Zmor_023929 [Zophobas morio]|uniref:Uncharacterized protein n=1 Tax=Zophobas morio TaxID=2755281 RepID=A0AA38I032_9CUCU|nr:hypothetical protein Zmor_023929 [Zophobas morio]